MFVGQRRDEQPSAFKSAVERLPPFSEDMATARLKLADAQFQLKDFAGALTNYLAITKNFSSLPEVKSNLLELALYQTVRASLSLPVPDLASATNAVTQILAWYPDSFLAGRSVLVAGQGVSQAGDSRRRGRFFPIFCSSCRIRQTARRWSWPLPAPMSRKRTGRKPSANMTAGS